jgi:hypothetical protein
MSWRRGSTACSAGRTGTGGGALRASATCMNWRGSIISSRAWAGAPRSRWCSPPPGKPPPLRTGHAAIRGFNTLRGSPALHGHGSLEGPICQLIPPGTTCDRLKPAWTAPFCLHRQLVLRLVRQHDLQRLLQRGLRREGAGQTRPGRTSCERAPGRSASTRTSSSPPAPRSGVQAGRSALVGSVG